MALRLILTDGDGVEGLNLSFGAFIKDASAATAADVIAANAAAAAALISQNAASASAVAASGSAVAASGSASAASGSASAASGSAAAALASQNSASGWATTSGASATASAASAAAAVTSQNAANASAVLAQAWAAQSSGVVNGTSFFSALVYAQNAAASATAAAASAASVTLPIPVASGGTGSTTAANARTALGLGTAATFNTGTSGAVVPLLNGTNLYSGVSNTFRNSTSDTNVVIDALGTQAVQLGLSAAGVLMWQFQRSVANNFNIQRYVGGVYQDNPISIANATGAVTLTNRIGAVNAGNLLLNGSGELGNTGWGSSNFGATVGANGEGPYFGNTAALTGTTVEDIANAITIGAGVVISLSGEMYTGGMTAGTSQMRAEAFNSSGTSLGTVCSTATLALGSPWTFYQASGTTPANTAYVKAHKYVNASPVAPINGVGFRRIKVETGASASIHSQEATIASFAATATTVGALSGRNRIINGDMRVAARGANAVATNAGGGYGGPDRWQAGIGPADTGQLTQSVGSINYLGVAKPSCRQTVNTASAAHATTAFWGGICQIIEGTNCYDLAGQTFSVSFLFQSSISGTFNVSLSDATGSYSYVTQFTATAGVSKYITIPGIAMAPAAALPSTNVAALTLRIGALNTGSYQTPTPNAWAAGNYLSAAGATNWAATVNTTLDVSDVQLEIGQYCTVFDRKSFAVSQRECERYFEQINAFAAMWAGNTTTGIVYYCAGTWRTQKRVSPTLALVSPAVSSFGTVSAANTSIDAFEISSAATAAVSGAYFTSGITGSCEL